MYRDTNCKLQAHRGVCTDAPENTMAAFRAAVEQHYDIIEFDPKFTKDNVCVILHDPTLNRTARVAGEKLSAETKITDVTFAELADIDVGAWFGKDFIGEHIPTLSQSLDYMKAAGMEAKIDNVIQKFTPEQIDIVFDTVAKHGDERVGLTCSDLGLLARFAARFPNNPLHYDGPVSPEALDQLATICAGHKTTVWMRLDVPRTAWNKTPPADEAFAKLVHDRGFILGIWILNEQDEMDKAVALGADIVETVGGIKPN